MIIRRRGYGSFPKQGVSYFGVLKIRILLFRVLYQGPLFSETLVSRQLGKDAQAIELRLRARKGFRKP